MKSELYTCPCCGFRTLQEEPGHFDTCDVCGWEDDPLQRDEPDYSGGANEPSLKQAQEYFEKYGISSKNLSHLKFKDRSDFMKDTDWKLIK